MDFCLNLSYLPIMPLISTSQELEALAQRWKSADYIAVDTEFVRTSTFFSRLCLVQVADAVGATAIDTLAPGINLSPLIDVLQSSQVVKVFHAARQDVEIFWQMSNLIPAPIFDTQVAAMVCGYGESVGYDTLVKSLVSANIDKSQRFTDWSRRPLSDAQVSYALDDVVHLRPVYEKLSLRLQQSGRREWLDAEMQILTSPKTYINDPREAWRRMRVRSTNQRHLARLQVLAQWREEEAIKRNVPRNRVISDKDILALASLNPLSSEELKSASHISNFLKEGAVPQILSHLLSETEKRPKNELPMLEKKRRNERSSPCLVELLKVLLKHRCQEAGVASKLVATTEQLEAFSAGDDSDVEFLKGWRHHLFGKDAIALREGRVALTASPQGLKILSTS